MNVTIVPSGTGLPLQSRMGSVSTTTLLLVRPATCMRKLRSHGSAATCWTTRVTEVSPAEATNCAAPAFGADALLIHATPCLLVTLRVDPAPPTDRLKFTGVGSRIRFWYWSKTKVTPLITFGRATGTREGRARKLSFPGLPGFTQNTWDCLESPRTTAIHRPALRSSSPLISTLPDLNSFLITCPGPTR